MDEPKDTEGGYAGGQPVQEASTSATIRGSSALLGGRMVALGLNALAQVLIVRYLSKSDYGAFAYALAVSGIVHRATSLIHGQCSVRFLSLYDEQRDRERLLGTIAMVFGVVLSSGIIGFLVVTALQGSLSRALVDDPRAMTLLLILFFTGVSDALDDMLEGALAVFSRPGSIFFRKYVLTPALLVAAATTVILTRSSVFAYAIAFLLISTGGVVIYVGLLGSALRTRGILQGLHWRSLKMPFRALYGFGLPLVTIELLNISTSGVSILLLGSLGGVKEVGKLRAILPIAMLNQLVIFTFTMLFMPLASRLYARGDRDAMQHAYWQTAAWLAVLSFPIFAMTAPFSRPVILALFGQRYESSAPLLAILSVGFYCNAALGLNTATLMAFGRVRFIGKVNLACTVVNIALNVALIPRYGALGVAISTCATLILQNVLSQAGLPATAGIRFFDVAYWPVYLAAVAGTGVLWVFADVVEPNLALALVATAGVSGFVLVLGRRLLQFSETFPELARMGIVGRLLTPKDRTSARP